MLTWQTYPKYLHQIGSQILNGLDAQDRKVGSRIYRKCLVAEDAVTFMVNSKIADNRDDAVELGRLLETKTKLFRLVQADRIRNDDDEEAKFDDDYSLLFRFTKDYDGDEATAASSSYSVRSSSSISNRSSSSRNSDSSRSSTAASSRKSLIRQASVHQQLTYKALGLKSCLASSHRSSRSGNDDQRREEKYVRFEEIHLREYCRIVGDNPSVTAGPPIA